MVLRAELVDRVNHRRDVLGVDVGRDTVTQVEDMARALAVAQQRVGDTLSDHLGRLAQRSTSSARNTIPDSATAD